MKHAFVTGGSGFLGGRLIEMLAARGVHVSALARSLPARARVERRGARAVAGDLARPADWRDALVGVDTIFHAAAHLHFWGSWTTFLDAHVGATRRLVDAAHTACVPRMVLISAASVVMRDLAPLIGVDETAPLTDLRHLPYSASKALAEREALGLSSDRLRITAVRPPLVWGPGDTVDRDLGDLVRAGRFAHFDGGAYPYAVCHVDNACHGAILAAERGRGGEAYFLADDEVTTVRTFLDARFHAAGLPTQKRSVPTRVAWAMAGLAETTWRLFRLRSEPPFTREVVRLMGAPFTIDTGKARRELGYAPVVSRTAGLAALGVTMDGGEAGR